MKKQILISAALVATMAFSVAPMFASAQTVATSSTSTISQLQAQLQALLSQIASLRAQIHQADGTSTESENGGMAGGLGIHMGDDHGPMMASGTASGTPPMMGSSTLPGMKVGWCLQIQRNLRQGSRGDDVKNLQDMLAQDPTIFQGSSTGFFGPITAAALLKFQQKFGIVSSTASGTPGVVGPMTRKFFENQCSPKLMMNNASGTTGQGHGPLMMTASSGVIFQGPMVEDGEGHGRPMMASGTASGTPPMMQR